MSITTGALASAANFNAAFASKSTANTLSEVQTLEKEVILKQVATPTTPASGYVKLYSKSDDELYFKNDAGTESKLSNQSGSLVAATVKTTTYTATTSDEIILCSASGGSWTLSLYAASTNSGRKLRVIKTDSTTSAVTIDPNSSETIRGQTTFKLSTQYESIDIICDGSNWHVVSHDYNKSWNNSLTFTPTNFGTISGSNIWSRRVGDSIQVRGYFTSGSPSGSAGYIAIPNAIDSAKSGSGGSKVPVGHGYFLVTGSGSLGTGNLYAGAFYDGSDTAKVYFAVSAGSSAFTASPGTSLAQNTSTFSFDFVYPVSGWEG